MHSHGKILGILCGIALFAVGVGCASDGATPPLRTGTDSTKVPTDSAPRARQPGTYGLLDVTDGIGTNYPVRFNDRGDILTSGGAKRMVSAGVSVASPDNCIGYDFNNLGHVLCGLDQKFSSTSYALWNGTTLIPLTGLDTFPASGFMALTLNDSDAVAGSFELPTFTNAGCSSSSACVAIWRGGKVTFPGLSSRYLTDVNNSLDLVLQDPIPTPLDPVSVYTAATHSTRDITVNPGYVSEMNDSGWVVGLRGGSAFVNARNTTTSLGVGVATGINNAGTVVGTIDNGAFMWQAGTMSSLTFAPANTLWTVKKAFKINNRGQILAQADDSSAALLNRWVVLTPVTP